MCDLTKDKHLLQQNLVIIDRFPGDYALKHLTQLLFYLKSYSWCHLSAPLQELFSFFFTFPAHRITCRLGHYLSDRMINRPIGGTGKGAALGGEREDVWQLAVNDPCHSSLSIQTPAPPIGLSEVPPDNSWVTFSRRWEWALFYVQKKWASLDHPPQPERGKGIFLSECH